MYVLISMLLNNWRASSANLLILIAALSLPVVSSANSTHFFLPTLRSISASQDACQALSSLPFPKTWLRKAFITIYWDNNQAYLIFHIMIPYTSLTNVQCCKLLFMYFVPFFSCFRWETNLQPIIILPEAEFLKC